jgi:hypothetical protein
LRASGEDHPFDLGYCDSAPTIVILSVCLSVESIWAIAIVPLRFFLSVCLSVCPPDPLDSPEYTPLELPTSRLYKLDFFFCFRRLRACRPLYDSGDFRPIRPPSSLLRYCECHDLLIEPVGRPFGASTLLLRRAGTLTAKTNNYTNDCNELQETKLQSTDNTRS